MHALVCSYVRASISIVCLCRERIIRTEKLEFLGHTLKEVKLQLATLLASNSGLAVTVPSTLKKGWLAYNHWGGVQPSDQHP